MNDDSLERRITDALAERACSLPSAGTVAWVPTYEPLGPRFGNRWRVGAVALGLAVGLSVFAVAIGTGGSSGKGSIHAAAHGRQAQPSAGSVTSLSAVNNADTQTVVKTATSQAALVAGTAPVAVQTAGADPVVVSHQFTPTGQTSRAADTSGCVTVVAATPTAAGYQGICTAPGQAESELAVTNDTGSVSGDSKWYFVWTEVPQGTAYVAFGTSTTGAKQVPLNGISYFTETGTPSTLAADPPVARAYDQSGRQLGEAHVPQWQLDLAKRL